MYAQIKHLSTAAIFLEGIGGILFIFGSSLGAYLLLVQEIVFDFWSSKGYSYEQWCIMYSFNEYQGPFLLQIIHQLIAFPILYDF